MRSTARAALQLFLQLLQRCRASTASTLCPGPTVEALQPLQPLQRSTASTASTALQPLHSTALYTLPLVLGRHPIDLGEHAVEEWAELAGSCRGPCVCTENEDLPNADPAQRSPTQSQNFPEMVSI